jgi:hypothetical protein
MLRRNSIWRVSATLIRCPPFVSYLASADVYRKYVTVGGVYGLIRSLRLNELVNSRRNVVELNNISVNVESLLTQVEASLVVSFFFFFFFMKGYILSLK